MGGGSSHETQYNYVDNTERRREEARQLEQRRLENERRQREAEERLRIQQEKRRQEERRRAEYRQQRQREIEQEEARKREEEERRLRLENELCLRRGELFDYKFGNKIKLDSFKGLAIDDVTKLRIGVFGPTGSGKSCFINTCERTVRQTDKGTAPDSTTGQEGTIILQDYLPELFFNLVDTRGFFNYNSNETVEFQNILQGKIQPGDNLRRPKEDQEDVPAMDLHPCPPFANRLHGVIIIVKANDPRLREGALRDYLKPVRRILQRIGITPLTVVSARDKLKTEEKCKNALHEASAATGSSPGHTFFVANYCKDNSKRNPETERMIFDILHCALLTAERDVKIMKQRQRNEEQDEMMRVPKGINVSRKVALHSADASVEVFLRPLQNEYQWSTNGMTEVLKKLSKDDITTISLLGMCWNDVQAHFPSGMRRKVEKELKRRNMISQECHVFKRAEEQMAEIQYRREVEEQERARSAFERFQEEKRAALENAADEAELRKQEEMRALTENLTEKLRRAEEQMAEIQYRCEVAEQERARSAFGRFQEEKRAALEKADYEAETRKQMRALTENLTEKLRKKAERRREESIEETKRECERQAAAGAAKVAEIHRNRCDELNERINHLTKLLQNENTEKVRMEESFHRAEEQMAEIQYRCEVAEQERARSALERFQEEKRAALEKAAYEAETRKQEEMRALTENLTKKLRKNAERRRQESIEETKRECERQAAAEAAKVAEIHRNKCDELNERINHLTKLLQNENTEKVRVQESLLLFFLFFMIISFLHVISLIHSYVNKKK